MKIRLFIKNTVILVATSLILRTVGVLFRIWLADRIGSEGVGLYQLIFSVYILAATFASSGVSTAVTRLVSENENKGRTAVKKIMKTAVTITLIAASASTAAVYFGAEVIAEFLLKDLRAVPSLKILSFSLPFMGRSSCMRGYFIARRKTLQPSLVQLLEQTVRIVTVATLITLTADKGLIYSAAAVLLGDTVAETVSFLINFTLYKLDVKRLGIGQTIGNVTRKILHVALPISGSGYLSSALHTAENLLIPRRLSLFYGNRTRGLELFGAVRGMALPILFFPASFLTSLATMLIPEVSSAAGQGNDLRIRATVERAVSITLTLSTLVATVFMFNAQTLGDVIYHDRDTGQIILILSPIVPFMYLESVTTGLLKGLDCQHSILKYNTADSVLRIISVYITLPLFGIKAYLLTMIISNCFTSSMGLHCLIKRSGMRLDLKPWVLLPFLLGTVGGILGFILSLGLHNSFIKLLVTGSVQCAFCLASMCYFKRKTAV
ncbi:MAG: oligosaccharide flippase family protein, partial [Clostridia bacterium]|nr:oligosaccharide flippase family protein [Clostridia bacterium]